jgi:TldD protein
MANTSLEPGKKGAPTLDELIADTKNGILIDGEGSFSIDHQRNNFQFGGDAFWEIKNGKKTRMLREVTYQAITTEFWNSCDAICGPEYWEQQGVRRCGKGQPMQIGQMSHGSAWARFRNVSVGGAQK